MKNYLVILAVSYFFIGCAGPTLSWSEFKANPNACEKHEDAAKRQSCKIDKAAYTRIDQTCGKASKTSGYSSYQYCTLMNERGWDYLTFHLDNQLNAKPTMKHVKAFKIDCYDENLNSKKCNGKF